MQIVLKMEVQASLSGENSAEIIVKTDEMKYGDFKTPLKKMLQKFLC